MITYTDRAAGELRARIRARLLELGRPDLARDLDGAWISTIHGFCRRLLTAYPLAAGIDPRSASSTRRRRGCSRARRSPPRSSSSAPPTSPIAGSCSRPTARGGCARCSSASTTRCARRGGSSCSSPARATSLDDALAELVAEATALAADEKATELQRRRRARRARPPRDDPPARAPARARHVGGPRRARRGLQRRAHGGARARARGARRARPRAPAGAADGVRDGLRRGQGPRVGARLRGPPAARAGSSCARTRRSARPSSCASARSWSTSSRTRTASRPSSIDLVCAGPPKELFFVGDEFQSIYGFRHADVAVFRDRREAAPQVLPLTLNYRSRPEVLAAVNELFADEFGDELPAARAGRGLRRPRASGRPSSCSSPTRPRTRTPGCTGAVPRRATSRGASASSSTRAPRRRARSSCSSRPAPTPSGSRRSSALSTCRRSG